MKENTLSSLVQINTDEFTNNNTGKYLSRFLLNSENQVILFDGNNDAYNELSNYIDAEKLLTSTTKNILEVSLETGFSSVSYFNRTFKRYRNCTPSNYRKIKYSLK